MKPSVPAYAILCLSVLGCVERVPPSNQVRDSAGILISENTTPSGPTWILDSVPQFDIGPAGGPASEFISSPVSAVRLEDGRIVAAGWAMTEVKVFDSTGRWIRTIGRRGAGPGEFEALGFVYRGPGDSLITFEPGSQRVQRWTPAGEFVSLKPLTSPEGRGTAWLVGLLGDGSLLLSSSVPDEAQNTALTTRNRVSLFRASGIGEPWDSLFSFGGRVSIRHPQNPSWTFGSPIFAPAASWAQRAGRIAFTAGDRFEIELRNSEGRLRMIVRRAAPPRTVSGAEFERALSAWVEGLPADRKEQILPRLRETSTNRIRPAVSEVWLASNGRIWVTFGDPAIGERVQASVFDSLGRWESDVTVPVGVQINQVDSDGLLGTVTDGEGFRHIRFYRLRRAAP